MLKPINIGFGNIVIANRIVAVVSPDSAPIKRLVKEAKASERLIDATLGRRGRAVIITDDGHLILSSLQPETLANRILTREDGSQQLDDGGVRHES